MRYDHEHKQFLTPEEQGNLFSEDATVEDVFEGMSGKIPTGNIVWVNVYVIDRVCGGREEGGWWYDTGTPIRSYPVYKRSIAERLAEKLRVRYPRTRRRYSVLGGEDFEVRIETHPAEAWPHRTPRYE